LAAYNALKLDSLAATDDVVATRALVLDVSQRVDAARNPHTQAAAVVHTDNSIIYTTINFAIRLSVTTEVGALYARLICGWLSVALHGKQT